MCVYMKLSPFPRVCLDVFNNKALQPNFDFLWIQEDLFLFVFLEHATVFLLKLYFKLAS